MASTRISTPMRSVTSQLSRLSLRHDAASKPVPSAARTITTSPTSRATVSSITTSANAPIVPFDQQTVNATIHHFPSLEPLHFETYPATHLYLPTRRDILHRAVIFEGDAARRGTASTKWRDEVRGSARKIRPQKGSGRARLGDKKSPMLKGGGVAFGPKPRDFSTELQKKVYDLAWRTALSYRFRKGELVIVDNPLELESPSSSLLRAIFDMHNWGREGGRSLLVTLQDRPLLAKTLAEAPKEGMTLTWDEVDVKDLLGMGRIVIERKALQNILLTHQEDLPRHNAYSKLHKMCNEDMPTELAKMTGWKEFRRLETADPEELERLEPTLYDRIARKRIAQAEKLRSPNAKGSSERLVKAAEVETSAYELLSEAKLKYADLVAQSEEFKWATSLDDNKRVQGLQKQTDFLTYHAQSSEHKAEVARRQGRDQDVEDWEADAEEYRARAADAQTELNQMLGIEPPLEVEGLEGEDDALQTQEVLEKK